MTWVRAALHNPLHPITTAPNQPKWGMGSGSQQGNGQNRADLVWEGAWSWELTARIPVWKAELIFNFPEGISMGWNWGLGKSPGSENSLL